jgi:hypothetical protein
MIEKYRLPTIELIITPVAIIFLRSCVSFLMYAEAPFMKASEKSSESIEKVKNIVKDYGDTIIVGRHMKAHIMKSAAMANATNALV